MSLPFFLERGQSENNTLAFPDLFFPLSVFGGVFGPLLPILACLFVGRILQLGIKDFVRMESCSLALRQRGPIYCTVYVMFPHFWAKRHNRPPTGVTDYGKGS